MTSFNRRQMLQGVSALGAGAATLSLLPAWAGSQTAMPMQGAAVLSGNDIQLNIGETHWPVDGRPGHAVTINGTIPGPLIRLREGQDVRLAVTNTLSEDTSIHWHGVLVPHQFDGVPGLSFPGIRPASTFIYEFPIRQSGTYWYHSHSGLQEQQGHYGAIIIDPAGVDPIAYDREYVVVLSDFSFMHPHEIFRRLKHEPGVFNFQRQTVAGLLAGRDQNLSERMEWARMRMDPTDISDVTGSIYKFLINGHGPTDNWTGLFNPGERVRLRFINAAAMTLFNVRIPGLPLTVVQADGQNVRPVTVDEFQISVAETYDVIVHPTVNQAFTLVAEAVDRSGMARGTLAPRPGMTAEVPPLRPRPLATMRDMGMDMGGMDMGGSQPTSSGMSAMDMGGAQPAAPAMSGMDHGSMDMSAGAPSGDAPAAPSEAPMAMSMGEMDMSMRNPANAPQVRMGPGVQTIAPMPVDRLGDPGQGLENVGHRVLTYRDLVALERNPDVRAPSRSLEIHLTGNMERFMWAFDGEAFGPIKKPIAFQRDERVRVVLINDTMMAHPIHLHGLWSDLEDENGQFQVRKHTIDMPPGSRRSYRVTADALGRWAYHCHLLYHMEMGMFREVRVHE